ncbi:MULTISPECIES: hypothetical protein [Cupriavidus]|uniref:hypothetical protein n=1 Tax=Cupriavidus sp. DF5525 TaxID=3160989 RepID=UPI0003B0630C|nr:hypothetical protein N234_28520 [Ralstonia pickettii DTP0602]
MLSFDEALAAVIDTQAADRSATDGYAVRSSGFVRVGPHSAGQLHHVPQPYYDSHRWRS